MSFLIDADPTTQTSRSSRFSCEVVLFWNEASEKVKETLFEYFYHIPASPEY